MKTVLVIYSNHRLPLTTIGNRKKYAFNTEDDLKPGDMLNTTAYDTKLQVVKVLDKSFKYYNEATGELSDEFTSTRQWVIKKLIMREDDDTSVYGNIIDREDEKK